MKGLNRSISKYITFEEHDLIRKKTWALKIEIKKIEEMYETPNTLLFIEEGSEIWNLPSSEIEHLFSIGKFKEFLPTKPG